MKMFIGVINKILKTLQKLSINSIRTKLLCVLIVILTLPMSIGIIYSVRTFGNFAEGQAYEKVENDLAHSMMIYENKKNQIETITKSIAMDNAVKVTVSLGKESLLGQQLGKYLEKFLKKDMIDWIIITDNQANIIARKETSKLLNSIQPEKNIIRKAIKGGPIASSYAISKNEFLKGKPHSEINTEPYENDFDQYVFIISACPLSYNDKTVGVVTAGCLLNENKLFLEEMKGKSEIEFAIIQKDQMILTNLTDLKGNLLFGKKINLLTPENRKGQDVYIRKVHIEKKDYIFNSVPISNIKGEKSAIIAAFKDADTIKAMITETISGMVIILVLGLILVIILVVFVGYHFTEPIKKLVKRTEMIAKGDLSSPIAVKSKDEIGLLAKSFNRMTESLKISQSELISARDYTDNIIRSMNDTLIVTSPSSIIQTVNAAASDLLEYDENELIGQPVSKIFAEEPLPADNMWLQNLINEDSVINIERVYLSKNGVRIPVLFSASMMRSNDNKIQGIVFVAIDITERKRAEKALQDSEEKYRTLIESSSDAIMTLNEKGYLSCNSATLKMFGCSHRSEFLAKHPSEFSPPLQPGGQDSMTLANENMKTAFETGKSHFEWLHMKLDGTEFSADVLLTPMELGGHKILQAVVRDITERKQTEQQIKTSLKEKEVLLKEIHHRVKNNLQVITSLLNLQSKNIKDKEALIMFRDSQSRVKSMALIHEKLYQSKDLARIDFSEYTRNLTNYLMRSFENNSISIKLYLNVDKIMLGVDTAVPCGLIINELFSNSLKYAFKDRENGEININFSENDDGKYILTVSDNGSGFKGKADLQTTDSLGLQLVSTLTRQLGGVIQLDAEKGTKFSVIFPIPQTKEKGAKECQKIRC
ncbi:MAG: PAS domain S-box protein [candidate division Zixibacteria bacterium]|nr:PAS domain S-box protein [candidate division Zixibacteria bacterium]